MIPTVNITQVDGGLGSVPIDNANAYLAVVGPASAGALNTPAAYGRPKAIVSGFASGPLVEASCYWVQRYGRPAIPIRTNVTTAASSGSLVATFTGTSVPTFDGASSTDDDYELYWIAIAGGTIGVTGITFQWSLDGGRTMSATTALGTATTFTIPSSGGNKINFAAGTIVAGDFLRSAPSAGIPNAAQLATALTALQNTTLPWEIALFTFPIDSALFDQIETSFAAMFAAGRYQSWIGGARRVNVAESEASYKTALDAIFTAKSTISGMVCGADAKIASAVTGRQYRRGPALAIGALQASVSEEINIAAIDVGAVPGVTIVDANGNPENHDETVNPGLDDSRFCVLRSWPRRNGPFVNRPLILCPSGSDFTIYPHRRVMNLYLSIITPYLQRRLNKPIRVKRTTGFIVEADAVEIEAAGRQLLRAALRAKPKVSDIEFNVSRTDNLLTTKTMTCDGGILPLAYPETINFSVGFFNAALQTVTV